MSCCIYSPAVWRDAPQPEPIQNQRRLRTLRIATAKRKGLPQPAQLQEASSQFHAGGTTIRVDESSRGDVTPTLSEGNSHRLQVSV